jgi:UDP-N-acetylmuramate--alanine ligase
MILKSLSNFDEILLMDIYPSRELPMEGLPQNGCCRKLTIRIKNWLQKKTLLNQF